MHDIRHAKGLSLPGGLLDCRIIEAHLRVTDQWPDLYGRHWLDAVVELYSKSTWRTLAVEDYQGR
ncbi:MAG: hypothetical protein KGL45_02565 [Gammaproteobacteria bacterium]|nr:hypothetical protein [Gammaproteobacteria bacterium]